MKISHNWLKNYIDVEQSPKELADILTMLGLEVSTIEQLGGIPGNLEGVVVGKVVSAEQHPNADRLKVCKVDVGADELLDIVCGAPNVAAGQLVPVATVGTSLQPKGADKPFKIKKQKVRGEVSQGMICAEDELGVGTAHDGIMVFEGDWELGSPAINAITLDDDHIYEIDLTPNRIDGASHYGVARDLAAYFRTRPNLPEIALKEGNLTSKNPIPVAILDEEKCKRYVSIYIEGVSVSESPDWLKKRLTSIGLRPINNIVDITNFVLHELGQPLHAFDADQLKGKEIIVKTLDKETKFTTLDDQERTLIPHSDLLICDAERPLCIAGTMGGINSGVTTATKNVFLEAAYFDAGTVRRQAKRMDIHSDSSFRFERGVDPAMTPIAALRAASLIVDIAGGVASKIEDLQPGTFPHFDVSLSIAKTNRLIGKELSKETILEILSALEILVESDNGDLLELKVPPYRVDVQRDVDVIEDILRVYGYNEVEIPEHLNAGVDFRQYRDAYQLREMYSNYLSANGFYEIMNNSLVHQNLGDEESVAMLNPLSEDLGILRQSLLPGSLETLRYNQNRQQEDLAVYEFGKTYRKRKGKFEEDEAMVLTVMGKTGPEHWNQKPQKATLYTLTREAERIQAWLGFKGELQPCTHSEFDYGLELIYGGKPVLRYGKVASKLTQDFELRQEVFHMVIDWPRMSEIYFSGKVQFQPIPLYPSIRRDISMLISLDVSFGDIKNIVQKANPSLIRSVDLHDIYQGKGVPEDKKSYLISIEMQDDNRTLDDTVADKVISKVFRSLEHQVGAEIRK